MSMTKSEQLVQGNACDYKQENAANPYWLGYRPVASLASALLRVALIRASAHSNDRKNPVEFYRIIKAIGDSLEHPHLRRTEPHSQAARRAPSDTTRPSGIERVEAFSGMQRRRHYSAEQKLAVPAEAAQRGMNHLTFTRIGWKAQFVSLDRRGRDHGLKDLEKFRVRGLPGESQNVRLSRRC